VEGPGLSMRFLPQNELPPTSRVSYVDTFVQLLS
jgi:hypothetical protein